ncbi:Ubiquitin-conjugating enzyme E2 T [Polyrhizophydium stewartii]|uniref:Ubiquitin-conjugating enzyme E2 T n=1 Tax=Polyrhizophydium stewartii TaxID=2732419 RepID=A0ABR4N196_9FUNG
MQGQQRTVRMMREIEMLRTPPPGVSAWTEGDGLFHLGAVIEGLAGSPYEGGRFRLNIQIPPRFPFEPPHIQFMTPIYHPNIDAAGRICLDMLKMPPKGSWKPSVHLSGVLNSIRLLMQEPNPDDPLADDVVSDLIRVATKPPVKRSFASIKASKRAVDSDDDDDDDDAGGAGASRRRISRQ